MMVGIQRTARRATWSGLLAALIMLLTACSNNSPNDGHILVWVGAGPSAEQRTPSTTGQVAYLNSDGSLRTLLNLAANVAGVTKCGNQSTSPDGRYFTFFVSAPQAGADSGTLYQVNGTGEPQRILDIEGLSCAGNGGLRYTPNSQRFAFIDYEPVSERAEFAVGTLRLFDAGNLREVVRFDNVTAFDPRDESLAYLSLFTNARGDADEAAVTLWTGSDTPDEITALYAEQNCRFTSGQIASVGENQLAAVMGQRCPTGDTRTRWQFYIIDLTTRSATLALTDYQAGGYSPYTRTNNLITANSGNTLLFTPADGLTRNTTAMIAVDMGNLSADNVIVRSGAVMPAWTPFRFALPTDAAPAFSLDGRWLAMVLSTGTSASIGLIDLNDPAKIPTQIPLPDGGDSVSYLEFSLDSAYLYYVARGVRGADNSVFRVDMSTLDEARIQRGNFGGGVVAPHGLGAAVIQYRQSEGARVLNYVDLVYLKDDSSAPVTLYKGLMTDANGTASGANFIFPLSWRK